MKYAIDPDEVNAQEFYKSGITSVGFSPDHCNVIGGQITVCKTAPDHMANRIVKEHAAMKGSVCSTVKDVYGASNQMPKTRMGIFHLLKEAIRKDDLLKKYQMPFVIAAETAGEIQCLMELLKDEDIQLTIVDGFEFGDATEELKEKKVGKIASISGRYYAMDRDKRWDRVKKCYDALVRGEGNKATSATIAIEDSYQKEVFDEFVEPTVIVNNDTPIATIGENDSVIFFNFRPDRAREITRAIVDPEFDGFETEKINTYFVCFTNYDETMPNVKIAFKKEPLVNTFGEVVSKNGLKQLRIAETEKYAHVTFFFNGGEEKQYPGEDRILVPSPKVATYDLQPEMSAPIVTEKVVEAINEDKYNAIILNFANPDMVGHTGSLPAAIKAVETIDECVQKVVDAMLAHNGTILITADHGNCEQMIDYKTGEPHTAHTTNPVPLILVTNDETLKVKSGKLADLAPTMLEILGIEKPEEMTGESILEK